MQWAEAPGCNDTAPKDTASDGCGTLVVHSDDFLISGNTVRASFAAVGEEGGGSSC